MLQIHPALSWLTPCRDALHVCGLISKQIRHLNQRPAQLPALCVCKSSQPNALLSHLPSFQSKITQPANKLSTPAMCFLMQLHGYLGPIQRVKCCANNIDKYKASESYYIPNQDAETSDLRTS